jgi:pyrroline-5-carboxylate reductase
VNLGEAKSPLTEEKNMASPFTPMGFIGAGYFAELIIAKLIQTGTMDAKDIVVGVRRRTRAEELSDKYGIAAFWNDNSSVCRKCNSIILAVKPDQVIAAGQTIMPEAIAEKLLISIVAAVKMKALNQFFHTRKIFRVNPNPQIQSGTGLTAYSHYPEAVDAEIDWVRHLFGSMSETMRLDEDQLNYISVLSGITHPMYYIECLMDAAHYIGLDEKTAKKIVTMSLEGALDLFKASPENPGQLIRKAATPGGIGVEKLYVLDKLGFKNCIIESIKAGLHKANIFGA